jgi:hypothetical protein
MSKFDLVYEKAISRINEREYIDTTFQDNVSLMIKSLVENDYLPKNKSIKDIVNQVLTQSNNVKELTLDPAEKSMPPIKLLMTQDTDSESFSVTVVDIKNPTEQKEFKNSMLETIFDDVLTHIKTLSLANIAPESAVEELPKAMGANAQPEGGESKLPTAAPQQPA